jgi:hypothetical protein
MSPKKVKHQPTPILSIMIWRTARAVAARVHLIIFAEAAAVEDTSALRSVLRVPSAWDKLAR